MEKRGGQVRILKLQLRPTIVSSIFYLWAKLAHTSLVKIMLDVSLWTLVCGTQSVEPDVTLQ